MQQIFISFDELADYSPTTQKIAEEYKVLTLSPGGNELFGISWSEKKTEKHNYKFIVIDTVTALEEMALPYANKIYRELPIGANFDPNANILTLPNGAGYQA